jgi:hypothetical protein
MILIPCNLEEPNSQPQLSPESWICHQYILQGHSWTYKSCQGLCHYATRQTSAETWSMKSQQIKLWDMEVNQLSTSQPMSSPTPRPNDWLHLASWSFYSMVTPPIERICSSSYLYRCQRVEPDNRCTSIPFNSVKLQIHSLSFCWKDNSQIH